MLHPSQPGRHGSEIKSHARADPERGDPSGGGLFEDRHLGHREEFRQILGGQGPADLLDLICDAHSVGQHFLYFRPDPAWAEFVMADLRT
jgi:hypothetical protein